MAKPIFTNKDTMTWVQKNGIGTVFELMPCTVITNWSRDYEETTYVKSKSPDEYGKKTVIAVIQGNKDQPKFDVVAYTSREHDFLIGLTCPVDFQLRYGTCSTPGDPLGYSKIRHFYRARPTSEGEDNTDFIGDENYDGVQIKTSFTCEDVITVLKPSVASVNTGVTEAQGFNDVSFIAESRCEGECGAAFSAGQYGIAVANANYGLATANAWYTRNGGSTWSVCSTDPFGDSNAHVSSCLILPGVSAPRFIVARGNPASSYGVRFSISDDWGDSWNEIDGGGTTGVHYINSLYRHSDGFILATGNDGRVYISVDRGTSWTSYNTGTGVELYDVHTNDGETIYAVGGAGTIVVSPDLGETWQTVVGPSTSDLYTVQVVSAYRVLVGGALSGGAVLWATNDGGATWSALSFTGSATPAGAVRRLRSAKPAVAQHFVLIHGVETTSFKGSGASFRFYRTLDGGATWERMSSVTNNGLNALAVIDINTAFAVGEPVNGVAAIQKMSA